jgi:hypothetical protein
VFVVPHPSDPALDRGVTQNLHAETVTNCH